MKKILSIFIAIFFLLVVGVIVFVSINTQPVSSTPTTVNFVVNKGEGISSLSTRLQEAKVIRNRYVFLLYARKSGLASTLKAGKFSLDSSSSIQKIITQLSQEGLASDYWFKILDGSRLEEVVAAIPEEAAFTPQEFEAKAKGKLGTIFPDSYLIPNNYSADEVLNLIEDNFNKKLAEAKAGATNTTLTDEEVLIFASLLEREARTLKSKQEVAGVLLNRLSINMPLQLDASVQYARDSKVPHPKNYWEPVVKADLSIDSAYNTYKNTGLTPMPICNPGYNSLYAAYHPIESDNLYYITGNDNLMHYAKTLDEHNLNIDKYLR